MLINGGAGAGSLRIPNTSSAGGETIVVSVDVSVDVSGDVVDYNGGTVMLFNGSVSSVDSPWDSGTRLGANDTVGDTGTGSTSVREISVLMFALSIFDVRHGQITFRDFCREEAVF